MKLAGGSRVRLYLKRAPWRLPTLGPLLLLSGATAVCMAQDPPGFQLVEEGSCMEATCHADLTRRKYVHAIAEDDSGCEACHEPVARGRHGFSLSADPEALCGECHGAVAEGLLQHAPVAEGDCLVCHDPHASDNPALLVGPYPVSLYAEFASDGFFCFDCHDERGFTEARNSVGTAFSNGDLNLHYRHVNRPKGRTCRLCHEHHGARRQALIRDQVRFGGRTISIEEFGATETGGFCGPTCHQKAFWDRVEPAFNAFRVTPRPPEAAKPAAVPADAKSPEEH